MEAGVPLGEFWAIGKTGQGRPSSGLPPSKARRTSASVVFAAGS